MAKKKDNKGIDTSYADKYNNKYDSEVADKLVWSLASKNYTDTKIAEAMKISRKTFYGWLKRYSTFEQHYKDGKLLSVANVEKSLYDKTQERREIVTETTVVFDADGNSKPVAIKKSEKIIPADTKAIMYYLGNRTDEWTENPDNANDGDGLAEALVEHIKELGEDGINLLEKNESLEKKVKELEKQIAEAQQ